MATLPRGITAVSWKNSTKSKEKIVKYRVRVQKKVDDQQVKLDSLFDTLQQAVDELNNFKSKAGSYFLSTIDKLKEEERKKVNEFLVAPPISVYISKYITEKIDTRKNETQTQQRNTAVIKSFFKTILKTKIPNRHYSTTEPLLQAGGMLALIANNTLSQAEEKKEFGAFKVQEISYIEINDYIKERLKTVKKISVTRELSFIKKVFNELKYYDKSFFSLKNPVLFYDKGLLANSDISSKNSYRLSTEDKDILFGALHKYSNWELKAISLLSYYCGFSRSEIVPLTWEQVNLAENYVQLYQKKSGQPRKVYILKEAKEIFENMPKTNGDRLFSYGVLGFSGSFDKLVEKLGLRKKGFRFHFFRREAISNLVFNLSQATGSTGQDFSILISEILGIENIASLERNHINQLSPTEIASQNQVMKSVGHSNKKTTKRYSRIKIR
ncbi:site-specific integrase [Janthinobacterium psychrotolerans]|uniref:Phage integrase family protein n=1 Tax=Janthinobacterium psychrotolerans TaxID=1747903 RepID=A0A1A7C054_9BURK|nr:site-specific integrase [Janthinobacterium psychrotolerans]OBV39127.1 Phage integrase family protein [Janthinobacterium psychrotolerans]